MTAIDYTIVGTVIIGMLLAWLKSIQITEVKAQRDSYPFNKMKSQDQQETRIIIKRIIEELYRTLDDMLPVLQHEGISLTIIMDIKRVLSLRAATIRRGLSHVPSAEEQITIKDQLDNTMMHAIQVTSENHNGSGLVTASVLARLHGRPSAKLANMKQADIHPNLADAAIS